MRASEVTTAKAKAVSWTHRRRTARKMPASTRSGQFTHTLPTKAKTSAIHTRGRARSETMSRRKASSTSNTAG
jgi:hypothetical protein